MAWRLRSGHPGRPQTPMETRDLIRKMSIANPLWGAPRIHGELLKLGIVVSQATVGRYMPWRPAVPSPTWRSFLHNHMGDTVAIDMFVVATATFRLLYTVLILGHNRLLPQRFGSSTPCSSSATTEGRSFTSMLPTIRRKFGSRIK